MEKKRVFRSLSGLTQLEIAMLLKVTRSQWSHYEANRRDLPNDAGIRAQEMLSYMSSPKAIAFQKSSKPGYEKSKTKLMIEKRITENEYQLAGIARKIFGVEKKLDNYLKAVRLMEFLNSPEEVKKATSPEAVRSITSTSITNFIESKSQLDLLEIDQKLLQYETVLLKEALEKLA